VSGTGRRKILLLLFIAWFLGLQCGDEIHGDVIEVTPSQVLISLRSTEGVVVGKRYSLWRQETRDKDVTTVRVGTIEIIEVISAERAAAKLISGNANTGDKVTRWLVQE
jgi:hypothetical protein